MSRTAVYAMRFAFGALAVAALVASEALDWGLSGYVQGMLGAAAGWVLRAPGDAAKA